MNTKLFKVEPDTNVLKLEYCKPISPWGAPWSGGLLIGSALRMSKVQIPPSTFVYQVRFKPHQKTVSFQARGG